MSHSLFAVDSPFILVAAAAAVVAVSGCGATSSESDAVTTEQGATLDGCGALTPSPSPQANYAAISTCLAGVHRAVLLPGDYAIPRLIQVPDGATLSGGGAARARVFLAANDRAVVVLGNNAHVTGLRLDVNAQTNFTAAAIFEGSGSIVDDCLLFSSRPLVPGTGTAGVIFHVGVRNRAANDEIHSLFYGALFFAGLAPGSDNVLEGSSVHENKCDSVTFGGFGIARNNEITHNGYDCENGPIPGGGVYSLRNDAGGVLSGNTIHDNCGQGIDIDTAANFTIEGNDVYDPGYDWNGVLSYCGGAVAASLLNLRQSRIRNNTFANNERPQNAMGRNGDPHHVFHARGARPYSDLPSGAAQTIALILAADLGAAATGNVFENNAARSYCSSGCVGLGYFTSRNTGFDGAAWSGATTNYFTGTDPNGSQIGSRRCGGNWYAANATCAAGDAAPPCNQDDAQHNPPAGNWARNDACALY